MSEIGSFPLQVAIVTSLKVDTAVAALVADRVFDSVPQGAAMPYIVVGEGVEADDNFFGANCHAIRTRIECWTQDGESAAGSTGKAGYKAGNEIAEAVKTVLFAVAFQSAVTGHNALVLTCDAVERKRFQEQSPYLRVVAPSFVILLEDTIEDAGDGDAPSVAVFSDGAGGWEIRDGNTSPPDAYIVTPDSGVTFVVDPNASSGLSLAIIDGRPVVTYP